MTRRRLLLALGLALAVLVVAVAVWWTMLPRPGITEENYGRITYGMTLAQVRGLLGGEAQESESVGNTLIGTWRGDDGLTVRVTFQGGRVIQRARLKDGQGWCEMPPEPFPARLLHRLQARLLQLLPW
jgi:hypothetical protein